MDLVVVAVDSSKGAQAAVRWVAANAGDGTRVVAAHVVPPKEDWTLAALQVDTGPVLQDLEDLLNGAWTEPLRKAGVPYTTKLLRGDPALELLKLAERRGADALVVGSRSHTALHDLVIGSTAHRIVNRATVPVVLVPGVTPGARAKGAKR